MDQLQKIIDAAFERRADITPRNADAQLKEAVDNVITQLDSGSLRVAEKNRWRMGHAPMVEKSRAAVFPSGGQRLYQRRFH